MKEIEVILNQVKDLVKDMLENINQTDVIFQEQAAAIEEITANVEELASLSVVLEEMSKDF